MLMWNMDEATIDIEYGRQKKVSTDLKSNHDGAWALVRSAGRGKHMTLVVSASAAGQKCPPFIIIQSVNVIESWIVPFDILNLPNYEITKLCVPIVGKIDEAEMVRGGNRWGGGGTIHIKNARWTLGVYSCLWII